MEATGELSSSARGQVSNRSSVKELFKDTFNLMGGGKEDVSKEQGAVSGIVEVKGGMGCYLLGSYGV